MRLVKDYESELLRARSIKETEEYFTLLTAMKTLPEPAFEINLKTLLSLVWRQGYINGAQDVLKALEPSDYTKPLG